MLDFEELKHNTLSDFMKLPVLRLGDYATVVLAYYKGKKEFPVKLIGFRGDLRMEDPGIRKHAYHFWLRLQEEARRIRELGQEAGEQSHD